MYIVYVRFIYIEYYFIYYIMYFYIFNYIESTLTVKYLNWVETKIFYFLLIIKTLIRRKKDFSKGFTREKIG